MTEIGTHEARVHFSEFIRRVQSGEEFMVTIRGIPAARILPIEEKSAEEEIDEFLTWSREFKAQVAKRGPILRSGESWKDLAREGLA